MNAALKNTLSHVVSGDTLSLCALLIALALYLPAQSRARVTDSTVFAFTLDGEQENACTGSGSDRSGFAICVLNADSSALSIHLEHNLDVGDLTGGQIHVGPVCETWSGAYLLGDLTSPIDEVWALDSADVEDLLSGNLYINFHSLSYPEGEIRGQIVQEPRRFSFTLDESQINTVGFDRTLSHSNGVALCELNATADEFRIRLCHDVEPPYSSGLHIHKGLFGEVGQVQFFILDPASPVDATWLLDKDDLINLFSENLYLNLHSSLYLDGEIRGQIRREELRFVFGLDGAQANSGAGTGSDNKGFAILTLSGDGREVSVHVEHDIPSDSASGGHIHTGAYGVDGPVSHSFTSATSPISESWLISDSEFEQLVSGQVYIDIETLTNPSGEIRGQAPGVTDTSLAGAYPACDVIIDADQANACGGSGSANTAGGFVELKKGGRQLNVSVTHSIPSDSITLGHIHTAPECTNGPVAFSFTAVSDPIKEVWYPSHSEIVNLMRGDLYVNLHSDANPAGELRGQIVKDQGCCNVPGDADGSGSLTIGDVTFLIARIFGGGPPPDCCEEGDADSSGAITIGDVTYLIARIFGGGPAPICGPTGLSCSVE